MLTRNEHPQPALDPLVMPGMCAVCKGGGRADQRISPGDWAHEKGAVDHLALTVALLWHLAGGCEPAERG